MNQTKIIGKKKLDVRHTYIKTFCEDPFIKTYRAILYHPELPKLSKLLAFVMLDKPERLDQNFSIFARKMKITNASLSKARRSLQTHGIFVHPSQFAKT